MIILLGYANPVVFSLFLAGVLFLALLEFNRMGMGQAYLLEQRLAAFSGACVAPLLMLSQPQLLTAWVVGMFLLLALLFLFRFQSLEKLHFQFGWLLFGFFYLPMLLGFLVPLRLLNEGQRWIFLTLLIIMCCDTCAYFVGSKIGRRKLYPAVSPNKSVEGGIGGLLGSVLAVFIARYTFMPSIGLIDGVLIGLVLGTAGQLGDLFESLLKRACQVKDSGSIIPGHGGLLDRLDSLLFAFPLVYYIAKYGYGG